MLKRIRGEASLSNGLRLTMATTAFIIGASFCLLSDDWHSSPIFYYINQLPIPWFVYGSVLLVGGVCMFFSRVKPLGFLLAAILYTFFAFTIWLGVLGGLHSQFFVLKYLHFPVNSVGSFYAACNATTICVLYWTSLKNSIYAQVDPERQIVAKHL